MAIFSTDGIDDILRDLEEEPFECVCSRCGKKFFASQEELLQPVVVCPLCGAELDEV